MLKFLSMRAVSLSATMVLGVSGMALAASHVAEEVPVDPVPVIEEATVIAAEESAPTEEAEVAKEEVVAEDQLLCLDCCRSRRSSTSSSCHRKKLNARKETMAKQSAMRPVTAVT
ncbi:MAG: hypothetical protein KJN81_01590 [Acidimicrobiia bacterium]|nr:hypothetical protein [Acidimicrobiia bacterium]NNL27101.1 hypothetical protein [Acidimicrobiia bacterium]